MNKTTEEIIFANASTAAGVGGVVTASSLPYSTFGAGGKGMLNRAAALRFLPEIQKRLRYLAAKAAKADSVPYSGHWSANGSTAEYRTFGRELDVACNCLDAYKETPSRESQSLSMDMRSAYMSFFEKAGR